MGDRLCPECGSKVAKMYVVCDVCGEPLEAPQPTEAVEHRPDSHPGYEVRDTSADADAGDAEPASDPSQTVWCRVRGKNGSVRATVMCDGVVRLGDGRVLGLLNSQQQVASAEGHLLGYALSDQIYDETDTEVGYLNRGTGTLHDPLGSTILDADGIGCCRGHTGVVLGQFDGLGYRELTQIALYTLFLDPDFRDETLDDVAQAEAIEAGVPVDELPPPRLPDPAKVEVRVRVVRTDFVAPDSRHDLFGAGSGDKVTMELMGSDDVAALDFKSRMSLWSTQERQKTLALQPKLFTEDMVSVSVSDSVDVRTISPRAAAAQSPRSAAAAAAVGPIKTAVVPVAKVAAAPVKAAQITAAAVPIKTAAVSVVKTATVSAPVKTAAVSVPVKAASPGKATSPLPVKLPVTAVKAVAPVKAAPRAFCDECGSSVEPAQTSCSVCGEPIK